MRMGRSTDTGMNTYVRVFRDLVGFLMMTLALSTNRAVAQAGKEPATNVGPSIGMTIQRLQDNFGVSGTWSSRAFFNEKARITASGGVAWYPNGTGASGDQEWVPFGHSRFVLESGHRVGRSPLRLYGFGGAILIFRSERLSNDVLALAGTGGFGFEFFAPTSMMNAPVSYFIEIGGVGSGARATNLPGQPILLNGFVLQSGLRFYP